jgi:hypothetical protein
MNGDNIILLLEIKCVFGSLNAIQIVLLKSGQYVSETPNLDSFPSTFDHIWYNCDLAFVVIFLNWDFNPNSFIN